MADARTSKAVDFSCRVYRQLLMAYPKSHRQEYGPAILQLFRDQCRDAWDAARARGLITFWLRALADLLKTSLLERLSNLNRSRIMPIHFRPTIKPLPYLSPSMSGRIASKSDSFNVNVLPSSLATGH